MHRVKLFLLVRIPSIIQKCCRYGLRGIIEYCARQRKCRAKEREFFAGEDGKVAGASSGITLAAYLRSQGSLSKTARDFIVNLRKAKIPFQTFDVAYEGRDAVPECDLVGIITPKSEFRAYKYDHLITLRTGNFLNDAKGLKHSRVIFWEFESGFAECYPELCHGGELIAFGDFDYNVLRRSVSAETSVKKILYPFRFPTDDLPSSAEIRQKYGFTADDFLVFFNFDFANSFNRKNPDGVIRAFAEAFRDVPSAKLVFKTQCSKQNPDKVQQLQALADSMGVGNRLVFIHTFVPQRDLYGLTNACDVYISLHRGEGFGLGIAEAMSLGKAAVVTNYSAPTEFCKADNCMLVPYQLVDVRPEQRDHGCYLYVKQWADPDLHAAARALRKLYDDPELRTKIGMRAAAFMREYFSIERFRESVMAYLQSS